MNRIIISGISAVMLAVLSTGCGPMDQDGAFLTNEANENITNEKTVKIPARLLNKKQIAELDGQVVKVDVVKLPTQVVRRPSLYKRNPVVVNRQDQQKNYYQELHIHQDTIQEQPVVNHLHTHHQYEKKIKIFPRIINTSTHMPRFTASSSASQSTEIMPTTVVNAPTRYYSYYSHYYPYYRGYMPYYAGYMYPRYYY